MAGRTWALLALLALLAGRIAAQGQANFTSEAMAEGYTAAVAAAGKPHLSYDILPTERPLLSSMAQLGRSGAGWVAAGLSQPPPLPPGTPAFKRRVPAQHRFLLAAARLLQHTQPSPGSATLLKAGTGGAAIFRCWRA